MTRKVAEVAAGIHPGSLRVDSYVAQSGEGAEPAALAGLRAGMKLTLRHDPRRHRMEVLTEAGRLGWLPPEDAAAIPDPANASARVMAVVPAFQRPRILVRVELDAA